MKQLLCIIAFLLFWSSQAMSQLKIDGRFDDWASIPSVAEEVGDAGLGQIDILSVSVANDADNIYFRVQLDQEMDLLDSENLSISIDADNDPNTGFPTEGIGAEITYNFGQKNGFLNFEGGITLFPNHADLNIIPAPTVTSHQFEFNIARTILNSVNTIKLDDQIAFVISNNVTGGDIVPNTQQGINYQVIEIGSQSCPYTLTKEDGASRLVSYNVENNGLLIEEFGSIQLKLLAALDPDVIAFQELFSDNSTVEGLLDGMSTNDDDWECFDFGSDTKLCVESVFYEAGAWIDGNTANLLYLDDDRPLVLVNAHLPCCNNDEQRQQEIDHIMSELRDRDLGFIFEEDTPIIITGDLNLVGLAQDLTTLLTGDIVDEQTYGPDYLPDPDGTSLTNAAPYCTGLTQSYTWNNPFGSYPKGILDYIIYSDSNLKHYNSFVLATEGLSQADLMQYNLSADDSQNASDHYPIVMDFGLVVDNDGDGFTIDEDCDDDNPAINPNAQEIFYNGQDDDCDPTTLDIPALTSEDYLEFPFEGWKQVINTGYWTGWEVLENTSLYAYTYDTIINELTYKNGVFRWEDGRLFLRNADESESLICDFTLQVGDQVAFNVFGLDKVYTVSEKYRTVNLVQDSVWYMELAEPGAVSVLDTLRWMEGVGDLSTGIFRYSAGFEGGTTHACTLDSLNRRIGRNPYYFSECDCDYYLGEDKDNDGYANHIPTQQIMPTQSLSTLHVSNSKIRSCDTLSITVDESQLFSPMLSIDADCLNIIDYDVLEFDNTGLPTYTISYYNLPEVDQLYFFDQCIVLAEIAVVLCVDTDCDDSNAMINPGAEEVANNGIDEDCDGEIEVIDLDGDGYNSDEDCDDSNAMINPGAMEIANNEIDEDCDGEVEIIDLDGDGYNSDEDCDDSNAMINPGAMEVANNEIDEDCDGEIEVIDLDGDGYNSDEDCDDSNAMINPGAMEVANNGIDEDCDGEIEVIDLDGDGYNSDEDCDDGNAMINPGAMEVANNGIDEDCDGEIEVIDLDGDGYNSDEDCDDSNAMINPGAEEVANNEIDEDCDGEVEVIDLDGDGYNSDEDCDDSNALINPGAEEVVNNGIDEDCDGEVEVIDLDGDGYNSDEDCDDSNAMINPGAIEVANNEIDEDCDGEVEVIDLDGDGYNSDEDCDDGNALINPGAEEVCDGVDNNCDGQIDESLIITTYFVDLDMDGYGDEANTVEGCIQPPSTSELGGDCDDMNPEVNPAAEDLPNNGIDENCDGEDATSSIGIEGNRLVVEIYPNPFGDNLILRLEVSTKAIATIYSPTGQVVFETSIRAGINQLDMSALNPSLYFIRVADGAQTTVKKITKR